MDEFPLDVSRGGRFAVFSIALPGRFADWCDAVMVRLARLSGEEPLLCVFPALSTILTHQEVPSTLGELGRVLIGTDASQIVMGARQPDHDLGVRLAQSNARFLVALEDPCDAVADFLAEPGADLRLVVRAVANSCPLVMQCTPPAGALRLTAKQAAQNPAGAVQAIGRHFGIAVDAETAIGIAREQPVPDQPVMASAPGNALRVPAGSRRIIDGALLAYREWFGSGQLGQITWTRELFHLASDPSRSPTDPLDVSGGARIIIYGPYMRLPAGSWTAQVVLGFSREAAAYTYLVDAFADGQLAATTFQPRRPGIYTAELAFSLGNRIGKGVEVRVAVINDDAKGQLAFGHVLLNPVVMRGVEAAPLVEGDFVIALEL